jgi:predicted dienelactone hydrolase
MHALSGLPAVAAAALVALACLAPGASAQAPAAAAPFAAGLKELEFADRSDGTDRTLTLRVFYPAAFPGPGAQPFTMPMFRGFTVHRDAEVARAPAKFPLVMLSHGRGSSGLMYAWFAAYLASRGYVVAAFDHYRASRYDSTIAYLANKLWQRPLDVRAGITYLTRHESWGTLIDAGRIGIAGHSQGGFTALWVGGAKVNPDLYAAFQRRWRNDLTVPRHLRDALPVDAAPALAVADPRVKAAFAMAPGVVQAFGMDAAGLAQMAIPAFIIVGAADTVTPPRENAVFAAEHIRNVDLVVLPGPVGHEIFVNECDDEGRRELPETCVDAPGVDRAALHEAIGAAALRFFDANLPAAAPR